MSDADSFYAGLAEAAIAGLKGSTLQLDELRRENAALRKVIAEFPSTATDLQDRVTLLEQERDDLIHDNGRLYASLTAEVNSDSDAERTQKGTG